MSRGPFEQAVRACMLRVQIGARARAAAYLEVASQALARAAAELELASQLLLEFAIAEQQQRAGAD